MRPNLVALAIVALVAVVCCGNSDGPLSTTSEGLSGRFGWHSGDDGDDPDDGEHGTKRDAGTRCGDAGAPSCTAWSRFEQGLVGGAISDAEFDPFHDGRAVAAGLYRVFATDNFAGAWKQVGEAPFPIHKLAFPSADTILAASEGGLIASSDGGATWIVRSLQGLMLISLFVNPTQPQRLYVGTFGAGILRSNDGGFTWTPVNLVPLSPGASFGLVYSLTGDPNNPDVVLAGIEQIGTSGGTIGGLDGAGIILRTTDGGSTWTVVSQPTLQSAQTLATCGADPSIVYAAAHSVLLKSTDGGQTFTQSVLSGQDIVGVALDSTCQTVYAGSYGNEVVFRSNDAGQTWSAPLTNGMSLTAGAFPNPLAVNPRNGSGVLASSGEGLFVTTSGGDSWQLAAGIEAVSPGDISVSALEPDRLWMAVGGTLWSRTRSTPWARHSGQIGNGIFTVLADSHVAGRIFVGAGEGFWESQDHGTTFTQALPGYNIFGYQNIFTIAPDPTNPQIIYAGGEQSGVFKSTDGGVNWAMSNGALQVWPTGVGNFIWINAMLVDPANPAHLLMGTQGRGLYESADSAASWNPVAPAASTKAVVCLARAAGPPVAIYACIQGGGVMKSTDGGTTWTSASNGLGSLDVYKLAVDPATGSLYALTLVGGVFRSQNAGGTWTSFDNDCIPTKHLGRGIAVVNENGKRSLVVSGQGGVLVHAL
jgi:photosystem II stability/assembly factor-like uncharacterized protein